MTSSATEGAAPSKGRYRKVEVRTWGDERFAQLSPIPACGQGLWLYLITGPHTSPIPGLFSAGRAGMAEDLGWSLEGFDKAFREAFALGMVKGDFKARVVWVKNALRHNKPESPNVVKSWAGEFDLIPECDLKREAFEAIKVSIHALGEAYGKAFDEAFRKPSPKPSPKPSLKAMPNQEQEQEQEQEKEITDLKVGSVSENSETPAAGSNGAIPGCPQTQLLALWLRELPAMPQPSKWTNTRADHLRARWRETAAEKHWHSAEEGLAYFADLFRWLRKSEFLMGRAKPQPNRRPFALDLPWLVRPENFANVVEGKYHEDAP